ncbi:uncharacterized protein LOC134848530 isoform X2 [Symsagittifera roscoffensis]
MIRHCKAVTNVTTHRRFTPFIVGDMPFSAYLTPKDAVKNAARLVSEGLVDAVKMEGGRRIEPMLRAVLRAGIPVMGHVGLTPQTAASMGGMKLQGNSAEAAYDIYENATHLADSGCFSVVLEAIPHKVATHITQSLDVPTIGIGAGPGCSGQVQVFHDIAGMFHRFVPKFSKRFALVGRQLEAAVESYRDEVTLGAFPMKHNSFAISQMQFKKYLLKTEGEQESPEDESNSTRTTSENPVNGSNGICVGNSIVSAQRKKNLKISVIGAGAMGSLVAGKLVKHGGYDVTLISSWEEHVKTISQSGLLIKALVNDGIVEGELIKASAAKSFPKEEPAEGVLRVTSPFHTLFNPPKREIEGGDEYVSADVVFILTKGHSTRSAARTAATIIGPGSLVVTLQNGMGHAERIREEIGDMATIIEGTISHGALLEGPGAVFHTGLGSTIIGSSKAQNFVPSSATRLVSEILNKAGFETVIADNPGKLMESQWMKLAVNSTINPLTAVLGVKNGDLIGSPDIQDISTKLAQEFMAVVKARNGFSFPLDNVDEVLKVVFDVANKTKLNTSSMLSDLNRCVQTEIDYLNGFLVREGRRLNIPVSCNETLTSLVKAFESSIKLKKKLEEDTVDYPESCCEVKSHHQTMLVKSIPQFRSVSSNFAKSGKKVGFVPTMGGLHEGHLTLIRECKRKCDVTVVSIFVNPLQFAPHEDYDSYPRDLTRDFELLQAEKVDFIFAPEASELVANSQEVSLIVKSSDCKPEGASRPHFFHGVATIVLKLFNIVKPDVAYFGQKDAQQCSTIKQMAADLNVDCDIEICDTVREADGVAMSTRNSYLSQEERKVAPVIYKSLQAAENLVKQGQHDVSALKQAIEHSLSLEPMFNLSYIAISDNYSMEEVEELGHSLDREGVCISIAGKLGKTRLIDNIVIQSAKL